MSASFSYAKKKKLFFSPVIITSLRGEVKPFFDFFVFLFHFLYNTFAVLDTVHRFSYTYIVGTSARREVYEWIY